MRKRTEVARITADPGMLGYVQMLTYEMEGLRVLSAQIIRAGAPDGALYERYLADYKDACCRYFTAYHQLVELTGPEYTGPEYQSELSFFSGELIFYRREGTV